MHDVASRSYNSGIDAILDSPLQTAEILVIDTETNGLAGEACELTEIGAVLVGGGELHDRYETLLSVRAPLGRGIQRFTGITQAMVDAAPPAEAQLPELAELMRGRVLAAHNAAFDRRVLRQAFARAGMAWPDPPVLCTVALARRLAPLARQRALRPLAEALGIEVEVSHRALADAETCARVLCALFPRLCAQASTIREALAVLRPVRPARVGRRSTDGGGRLRGTRRRRIDTSHLPDEPGVYIFRNAAGQVLYVGKSVSLRTRARSHFAPSSDDGDWVAQAEVVDHTVTASELGALLLERRLVRELKPPGNVRLRPIDGYLYLRCRFDIAFPVLELAPEPAAGRATNIGPLRGRRAATELLEQLTSLFSLRHCGRALPRRQWPSAYGQMGRCLSPCLGDLDPNAYRRRLDAALGLFDGPRSGGDELLEHLDALVREAAAAELYERAAWLTRRRARLAVLLADIGGRLNALHARPRLVVAPHPSGAGGDAFWFVGGRVVPYGSPMPAVDVRGPAVLTPDQVADARIVASWCDSHPEGVLDLRPLPSSSVVERFVASRSGTCGVSALADSAPRG